MIASMQLQYLLSHVAYASAVCTKHLNTDDLSNLCRGHALLNRIFRRVHSIIEVAHFSRRQQARASCHSMFDNASETLVSVRLSVAIIHHKKYVFFCQSHKSPGLYSGMVTVLGIEGKNRAKQSPAEHFKS